MVMQSDDATHAAVEALVGNHTPKQPAKPYLGPSLPTVSGLCLIIQGSGLLNCR